MIRIFVLALPLTIYAQTVTFSPFDSIAGRTIWSVNVCVATTAPGITLRGGELYQMMALRGANPLPYSKALAVLSQAPARSIAGRIVKYAGWIAVTGGVLMGADVVTGSKKWRIGLDLGGAFLAVVIPTARREVPPLSDAIVHLLGPFLSVPAGGCSSAVVLGGPGTAFQVTM